MDTFSEALTDSETIGLPCPEPRAESSTGTEHGATGFARMSTKLPVILERLCEAIEARPVKPTDNAQWLRAPVRQLLADNATRWLPPPALSNDQRRELAGVLERGRLANAPADPKITAALLVQLSHVVLIRDCADHDAMMRVYVEDLSEIPPDLLHAACVTWRRSSKFWPTLAELRALIVPDLSRRRRYLQRALVLASVAENPAPDGLLSEAWLRDRRTAARNGMRPLMLAAPHG